MYFFLFDAIAPPSDGDVETEGFAIVWVNSAKYADCERAALEFAGQQGLTVREIQAAHKPTPEQLERMTLEQLAARVRGLETGVWGYFVPRPKADPDGPPQRALPLNKPPPNTLHP